MTRAIAIKALLTNFNGTYLALAFMLVATLIALVGPPGGDWLYRIGLVAAGLIALLAGTTLAEIKVKPLSFCMPGQERSMGPEIVALAAITASLYACLLFVRPVEISEALLLQQIMTLFCWSFGIFLLVVLSIVLLVDSFIMSSVLAAAFVLLLSAPGHSGIEGAWVTLTLFLIDSPAPAILFAVIMTIWALRALGSRELSRRLCGSPLLPLKAFDHPLKMEEHKQRMRRLAFRPSFATSASGTPGGRLLVKLSRRFAGRSWDYLLHESRLSGNASEFIGKILYVSLIVAFVVLLQWRQQFETAPLGGLYFLTGLVFVFFAPGFSARLSPMLPVSRAQHFRALLVKAAFVYLNAVLILLAVRLLVSSLAPSLPVLSTTILSGFIELRFPTLLILALNVPVVCWSSVALRSAIAGLVFMMVYLMVALGVVATNSESISAIGPVLVLAITAAFWLPFVFMAWKRTWRDDLLLE